MQRPDEHDEWLKATLSCLAERSYSLAEVAARLGVAPDDLRPTWHVVTGLRRCQGRFLLPGARSAGVAGRCWYSMTWRLHALLERFQTNEGLAVHYADILAEPEGGHFVLNLAATEIVQLVAFECTPFDKERLNGVCVGAYEPAGDVERLVANAGHILLHIETYREEPLTLGFIENLYADLVEGIDVGALPESEASPGEGGAQVLAHLCRGLVSSEDALEAIHPTLIGALTAFWLMVAVRPFPLANEVFGYVLYFLLLHRAGFHFSAHVPVVHTLEELGVFGPQALWPSEHDGSYDCTAFFEQAVQKLADEQRYIINKLDGMGRRRERFRAIVDADETMNARQKDVFLEALLHSNAEFSYAVHERRYNVSYLCARSDLARFLDMGLFRCCDDGVRHFFIADEGFGDKAWDYLRQRCPQEYARFYGENGVLREDQRGGSDAVASFNRGVGFYEPALMEDIWVEHYAHRRQSIAEEDGLRRHVREQVSKNDQSPTEEGAEAPDAHQGKPHKKWPDILLGTGGEGRSRGWGGLRNG